MSDDAQSKPVPVVLVVEDEKSLLLITTLRLEELGCRVIGVDNPEEALVLFESERGTIDFVFTDLRMGGMGGRGLIEELIRRDPHVRIVATSALIEELDALRDQWGSRVRMLFKPYSLEELRVILAIETRPQQPGE